MNESADIGQQRRTFGLELIRSVPQGLIETAGTTFAMYVAIRVFGAPVWMKMTIAAAASVGLLLSLFTVQIVRRLGCTVNTASVFVWCMAALGFAAAALAGDSAWIYLVGICLAAVMLTVGTPLISQIYRKHYSNRVRGRLFSLAGVVRATTGAAAGVGGGAWLAHQGDDFHGLFWFYAGCSIAMAGCVFAMAPVKLRQTSRLKLFNAFRHVSRDKAFRKLLICWMLLGMGNLLSFALFVEYISNPIYGFELDAGRAGLITSTIPMLASIICVLPWGMVFDRLPFYRVRVMVNIFFFAGILVYYLGGTYLSLCVGIALHGIGRSGGNVLWSLWVTRFSTEDHVGEYMSVHSCLTGFRGVLAPVIAFSVAGTMGPGAVAIVGAGLILLSSLLLIPELRAEAGR
ncbi:MAG: MFS transporter [Verrucomicrobiae bacterium]|nr:MFS transporter [Verrucomicrobiae bacterium]NNJ43674.1 MFS transporter [Akkermansiaceae bacterium]